MDNAAMNGADRISLEIALKSPRIWCIVCATEPQREIDVRMTYEDLFAIVKLIDIETGEA